MPYSLEYKPSCRESLKKACRKNSSLKSAVEKKIRQVLENPLCFKPLRKPLQGWRRVHVMNCFVLVYEVDEDSGTVTLVRFTHHDEAYG